MNETPCYCCDDRKIGCNSSCAAYAAWRRNYDADLLAKSVGKAAHMEGVRIQIKRSDRIKRHRRH